LCITYRVFQEILDLHPDLVRISRFLQAFGSKIKEDDRLRDGFYRECLDVKPGSNNWSKSLAYSEEYESNLWLVTCYNFRHAEKSDRGRGDQWRLRQTGVCQLMKQRQCVWILIHPPRTVLDQLPKLLNNFGERLNPRDSRALHIWLLSTVDQSWHPYIDFVRSAVEKTVSLREQLRLTLYLSYSQGRESLLFADRKGNYS